MSLDVELGQIGLSGFFFLKIVVGELQNVEV
jgi:hypothetical protein